MVYRKIDVTEIEVSEEDVFNQRLFNVFVAGVARSGTSMMSGIVDRLGVNFLRTTDTEKAKKARKPDEVKRFGDKFVMNEEFYEIHQNGWIHMLKLWSTPYSGQKIILPLNQGVIPRLRLQPSRVIQMWRDPEEIRQSQQASYHGNRIISKQEAEFQREQIYTNLVDAKLAFENLDVPTLHIEYRNVLNSPSDEIKKIAEFINSPKEITEAVEWVNPDKHRFKKQKLQKNA